LLGDKELPYADHGDDGPPSDDDDDGGGEDPPSDDDDDPPGPENQRLPVDAQVDLEWAEKDDETPCLSQFARLGFQYDLAREDQNIYGQTEYTSWTVTWHPFLNALMYCVAFCILTAYLFHFLIIRTHNHIQEQILYSVPIQDRNSMPPWIIAFGFILSFSLIAFKGWLYKSITFQGSFSHWRVRTGDFPTLNPGFEDMRPLANGADQISQWDPCYSVAMFERYTTENSFPGVFTSRMARRRCFVSNERLAQLTSPSNMLMLSDRDSIKTRIEYSNAHLHKVNMRRDLPLIGAMPCMDENLLAFGIWRHAMQVRLNRDF